MNTHRRPALFLVCAPERTRVAAYITSSLATPVNDVTDLNDHEDHAVLLAGASGLELNRWSHAARQRGRATCVISLSGQHRPRADVVAWPRLPDEAVDEARRHLQNAIPTPPPPAVVEQPGLFDEPPAPSAPAPPAPPRSPVAGGPSTRGESTRAVLETLKAWTPLPDKSCCARCPLCGADVRGHMGWHLGSAAGHNFQTNPTLGAHARAHHLAHLNADRAASTVDRTDDRSHSAGDPTA